MKILFRILLLAMTLSPAFCRAEKSPVIHNFHSDSADPAKLTFANSYHTAITPLLTYNCIGGAVFGLDVVSKSKTICMNLQSSGDTVTTTAVDSLSRLDIFHYPINAKRENIKVELSRDSVHWTEPLDGTYYSGEILLSFFPGKYYVRIYNTTSTKTSIYEIRYSFGGCGNCFLYIPEEE